MGSKTPQAPPGSALGADALGALPRSTWRGLPGGLRAQLLLALTLICAALLAVLALVMMHLMRHRMVQMTREHTQDVALIALAEMRAQPASATFIDRQEQLERMQRQGGMAFMAWRRGHEEVITTEDHALLAHYRARLSDSPEPPSTYEVREHGGQLYQWTRVRADRGEPDVLTVALPAQALQASLQTLRATIWIFLAANAALIVILGYGALTFLVMRPLKAISVATRRAAAGDLASPITRQPRNEFGALARSFNTMLETLRQNRQALEHKLDELARAHAQLQQTQDTLIRAEKLATIGQLAAGIAHEVGNPLAALLGYTELLQEPDLDEQTRQDLLVRMTHLIGRIHGIIRQLLDLSREDSAQPAQRVLLATLLREAMQLARASPRGRAASLRFEPSPAHEALAAQAVPSQLIQILLNLMINALDAMAQDPDPSDEPTLTMWLEADDVESDDAGVGQASPQVRVCLQDVGPGVPAELAARIFDPFFTTKEPGQGTGLGLSISLHLAQRVGGDLALRPSASRGACFVLSLPRTV